MKGDPPKVTRTNAFNYTEANAKRTVKAKYTMYTHSSCMSILVLFSIFRACGFFIFACDMRIV